MNIENFARLDIPHGNVAWGVDPLAGGLRRRHLHVHWLGLSLRPERARVYGASMSSLR